jgi:pimeloyl-ACP methyl ester carboxylesterase
LPPVLPQAYADAGIPEDPPRETLASYDYFLRQGNDADRLVAELASPALRRAYVRGFYTHRLLAGKSAFTPEEADWMAEPFGEAERLRAAIAVYEIEFGKRALSELPRLLERSPVPTLILYGPLDAVVNERFMDRMAVAFPDHAGPFVVHGSGHFVQWEAPHVLHSTLVEFFRSELPAE